MKLQEWINEWLNRRENDVSQSTLEKNGYHCRHIVKHLGEMELNDIHFSDVEHFYAVIDLAQNTIRSIHGTLSKCLTDAVRDTSLDIDHNPCAEANTPEEERTNFEVLSAEEAGTLRRSLLMTNPYDVTIYLALTTGMRRSEIMGLEWPNLDLDRGIIEVKQKITKTPGGSFDRGKPKSKSSFRAIDICPEVEKNLRLYKKVQEQRQERADDWPCENLVFTSEVGTILAPGNIRRRLNSKLEECDLKHIRFHDLRHTHATILLRENKHPKKVKERLGHGSVEVTLDRYSHVTATMQQELSEAFTDAIGA